MIDMFAGGVAMKIREILVLFGWAFVLVLAFPWLFVLNRFWGDY